jgi:hypothetical protein
MINVRKNKSVIIFLVVTTVIAVIYLRITPSDQLNNGILKNASEIVANIMPASQSSGPLQQLGTLSTAEAKQLVQDEYTAEKLAKMSNEELHHLSKSIDEMIQKNELIQRMNQGSASENERNLLGKLMKEKVQIAHLVAGRVLEQYQ